MGVEAKHDTLCIKKVLRSSIRISYRCATEHWVLFSLVLLLYLLYGSSPGFFAFVLSSSPVIICATLLLGVLLSYGSTNLPEFDEDGKDNQEQESKDPFSIKDNKGNEYADSCHNVHQSRVDGKETTFGLSPSSENDREDGEVVEKANQDKVLTDSQSDEVREVSEDKPAEKSGGTCKWGRAFSVRQRKKLADIKIEDINAAVENRLDSSVGSPFARLGSHESHDRSSGFDSDKAESSSPDTSMTDIAPVLHKIDPLLGADFPSPDVIANDDSGGYSNFCPQDSQIDSDSNDEADISQAKNDAKDGEEKEDDCNEHAFLWTDDDEKNVMDLGYAEVERNRRLEILMAKRRSRKNIRFDINRNLIDLDGNDVSGSADGFSCFPIQVPRTNPFDLPSDSDEAAIPGSAPSIRHPQKNPFDLPSEQSNDSGVPAHHNFDPQELTKVSHRDVFFRRHASFNFGSQERHLTRFKPYFVLEPMDFEEVSTSNFQRQFSDKSVSKLSVVTESDTISSVADQEDQNDLIKKDFLSEHASPDLLRQESDLGYVGSKCQDGINFVDHETLNAVTSRMESEPVGNTAT